MKHSNHQPGGHPLLRLLFTALIVFPWLARGDDLPTPSSLDEAPPACGASWCAARHLPGSLPPWAARIRDRDAAPAGAEDGIWDPSTPPTSIDLLFLYTPTALAAEGSVEGIQRRIDAMVASANRVFSNSLTGVQINLVHVAPVNQTETGSLVSDWSALQGNFEVQTLRDNYKADVVFVMIERESQGLGGVASIGPAGGDPRAAFGAFRRQLVETRIDLGIGLAHELGHIFGATHDREHAFNTDLQPSQRAFPYSYGHRFVASETTFADAMSLGHGVLLPYFSNPRLSFAGQSLGVAAGQAGEADVAQTITRMAAAVSRYRTANSRIGFTRSSMSVSESDPHFTVELERTGDLSTATRVNLAFASSAATVNLDYQLPASLSVPFAAGQSNATVQIPVLQDELVEGDESFRINLTSVQGQHGLARQSSLVVTIVDDEPSLTLLPGSSLLDESNGEAVWAVRFSGPLAEGESRSIEVVAGTAGDSATPGTDYEVTPATLTFTDTARVQSVRIRALADELVEPDETLRITIGPLAASLRISDRNRPGSPMPFAIESADGVFERVVALPSGQVAVAGNFASINGTPRSRVAIVDPALGIVPTFQGPTFEAASVRVEGMSPAWAVQSLPLRDGGWWVAGQMGTADGNLIGNLARLEADGALRASFTTQVNGTVFAIHETSMGRLLVGGAFTEAGGRSYPGLVQLNTDGTIDTGFRLQPGPGGRLFSIVTSLAEDRDGRLLVGGIFEEYNRVKAPNFVRLNADGSLDTGFPVGRSGANAAVTSIRPTPDGRAYVAGYFTAIGGRAYRGIARLTRDGSVDTTLRTTRPNGEVWDVLPLPNGQVLVSGAFTQIAGAQRRYLALLNEDGTVDPAFDPGVGPSDHCYRLTALADGSALVTGGFTSFAAQPAPGIARFRLPPFTGSFAGIQPGTNGVPTARVWGIPGSRLTLEASADLKAWAPVAETTVSTLDGLQSIPLPGAGDQRFFRIR